jgi:copper chaperone
MDLPVEEAMERMESANIKIAGMTCGGCVNAVTRALHKVEGVAAVDVSLERGEATVGYDPSRASKRALFDAVRAAGYEAGDENEVQAPQPRRGCCG